MNEDETPRYTMSSHSSRSLNIQVEDVKNLSMYIKNVSANIKNIDYQLNKRKNNKSFMSSNEIISESENDDEIKPPSNLVNPFSRNMLFKRNSTILFSTSYTKEKMINQSLLNKTSITEDSNRENKDMIMMMKSIPINTAEKNIQVNQKNSIKCEIIENKQPSHQANQESITRFSLKNKNSTRLNSKTKLINSQNISKRQSKTVLEQYNSIKKKEVLQQRNQRVKSQLTESLKKEQNKKINHKQAKTNPFSLTISSASNSKKKNAFINHSLIKPMSAISRIKYGTNNNDSNRHKPTISKTINKKTISKREAIQDIVKFKPLNDQEFAEMYLLYSEINILKANKDNNSNTNNNHYDYFNEMKTSYSIRNSDTYKINPLPKTYYEDKTNFAILKIQRHWRQWKISKLMRSASSTITKSQRQSESQSDLVRKSKIYFYFEMLKKDKDFKEMFSYITKANECYNKCLKNKLFEKSKNMILNDFIIENSKGELNEYSNIINLNLQLKKKAPIRPVKTIKKIIKK